MSYTQSVFNAAAKTHFLSYLLLSMRDLLKHPELTIKIKDETTKEKSIG